MKSIFKILGTSFLISCLFLTPAYAENYQIQKGDTLFQIAKKFHTSVETIQKANNLTSEQIFPGKYLYIPTTKSHQVKKGESLFSIAKQYRVSVQSIKALNHLTHDTIQPKDILSIPENKQPLSSRGHTYSASKSEIDLLAKIVHAEARGESLEGQIAVAAVILNRFYHKDFPNTISGVIYQDLAFSAVLDGQIHLSPNQQSYQAVRFALQGYDPSCGSLYYWNPRTSTSDWIWSRTVLLKIGNHLFGI